MRRNREGTVGADARAMMKTMVVVLGPVRAVLADEMRTRRVRTKIGMRLVA